MSNASAIEHVYGEFVRTPYFVLVHSRPRPGHERFDQYKPDSLTELVVSVIEHLMAGRPDLLETMSALDAEDKERIGGRTRRYIAKNKEELYSRDSAHLAQYSMEFRGYWLSTNAKHTQARQEVQLACRAAEVPYSSIRKLKGLSSDV